MDLSPWETSSRSAAQDFSQVLWNQKVDFLLHKIPPKVLLLSHINLVYSTSVYLTPFLILYSRLFLRPFCDLSFSGFPTESLKAFVLLPCVLHSPHIILLDWSIQNYAWWSYETPHFSVSPSSVQIFSSIRCSKILSASVLPFPYC